jgi:hypothetical protein
VKLTRALTQDPDEAIKKIQHLGNHGDEASQQIIKLEALCKQKEDVIKKLKEEKASLEGMMQSHDELIMEMADEFGLNRTERKTVMKMKMRRRRTTMEEMWSHLLLLCHPLLPHHLLLSLRLSSSRKRKTLWSWIQNRRPLRSRALAALASPLQHSHEGL